MGLYFSEVLPHIRLPEAHNTRRLDPSHFGCRLGRHAEPLYMLPCVSQSLLPLSSFTLHP